MNNPINQTIVETNPLRLPLMQTELKVVNKNSTALSKAEHFSG